MIRAFGTLLIALVAQISSPALADQTPPEDPEIVLSPLEWLRKGAGFETRLHEAGTWAAQGGKLYGVDPLTLWADLDAPLAVPSGPARLIGLLEPDEGRAAFMALIWSDAPVVCGEDLTTIGVDTGLAGFLTPDDIAAVDAYAEAYGDAYQGTYAEQLDAATPTIPFIVELPDGARFPVSGSGWGDGGYPVASLIDAEGQIVALYSQFITSEEGWLLPPPCKAPQS